MSHAPCPKLAPTLSSCSPGSVQENDSLEYRLCSGEQWQPSNKQLTWKQQDLETHLTFFGFVSILKWNYSALHKTVTTTKHFPKRRSIQHMLTTYMKDLDFHFLCCPDFCHGGTKTPAMWVPFKFQSDLCFHMTSPLSNTIVMTFYFQRKHCSMAWPKLCCQLLIMWPFMHNSPIILTMLGSSLMMVTMS